MSRLNLTYNSVSTTSVNDRVPVRVILGHLDVSKVSAAGLFEGLAELQLPVWVALLVIIGDALAVEVPQTDVLIHTS